MTSDVDTDLMRRLLMRIEADAHRRGWGGPPGLFVLYDSRDQDTSRTYRRVMREQERSTVCAPYAARPMVPSSLLQDGYPQHCLFRMAVNFGVAADHPHVAALLGILRQPGFLGVAFLTEAWQRVARDEQERKSWGGRRFADMPGSVENRTVGAVDVTGRDYLVDRLRGQKPRDLLAGREFADVGGSVVESLRMIVAAVAGLPLPPLPSTPSMWSPEDELPAPDLV